MLVYLLFAGYTPLFAGTMGLALTVLLILGGSVALGLPSTVLRVDLLDRRSASSAASFLKFGINAILVAAAVLVVANAFVERRARHAAACRDSLAEGAKNALPVGIACAIVGIIIGTHDADRRRHDLRPVHRLGRRRSACSCRWC